MTEPTRRHIEERVVEGKPLGRHVNHDPQSLRYLAPADGTVATARWTRRTPVLDQGQLGSCTGNAATGCLGTDPFYATLPGKTLDENEAVTLYSEATRLDNAPGSYPPDDTGSDGLSVAKACKANGLISGYTHITSLAAAHTAIQSGPFIVGSDWFDSFDNPDSNGVVSIAPGATVRGGHEYECIGYDAATDLWEFVNSWGTGWGVGGHFFYSSATFTRLLAAQGDATVFTPITAPAPVPTPPPSPASDADQVLAQAVRDWVTNHHHSGEAATVAKALAAWLAAKGL